MTISSNKILNLLYTNKKWKEHEKILLRKIRAVNSPCATLKLSLFDSVQVTSTDPLFTVYYTSDVM